MFTTCIGRCAASVSGRDSLAAIGDATVKLGEHLRLGADVTVTTGDVLSKLERRLAGIPRTPFFAAPGFQGLKTVADQLLGRVTLGRAADKGISIAGK